MIRINAENRLSWRLRRRQGLQIEAAEPKEPEKQLIMTVDTNFEKHQGHDHSEGGDQQS